MQRRCFLARTLAGIGVLTGASIPAIASARPRPIRRAPVLLQQVPLAGYQYHDGPTLWPRLAVGQAVRLTRERQNPYDCRAVRVDWRGHKLGYIPRRDNAAIAQLMDREQPLSARIRALHHVPDPWGRIELEVFLDAGSAETPQRTGLT